MHWFLWNGETHKIVNVMLVNEFVSKVVSKWMFFLLWCRKILKYKKRQSSPSGANNPPPPTHTHTHTHTHTPPPAYLPVTFGKRNKHKNKKINSWGKVISLC